MKIVCIPVLSLSLSLSLSAYGSCRIIMALWYWCGTHGMVGKEDAEHVPHFPLIPARCKDKARLEAEPRLEVWWNRWLGP